MCCKHACATITSARQWCSVICMSFCFDAQESVVTNAPFLKKNFKGRGDTKADLNTALRLLRGTIAETPLPKTWNLEVNSCANCSSVHTCICLWTYACRHKSMVEPNL